MTIGQGAEMISLDEAVRRLGLPRRTFARRLADGSIDVYQDGRDRRQRLVLVTDLERLTRPIVIRERTEVPA